MHQNLMDVDGSHGYIEQLFVDDAGRWLDAIVQVKNMVIGNNRQKSGAIQLGVIPRLLEWMIDEGIPIELRIEAAVVLGSLAKGTDHNIQTLFEAGAVSVLLKGIFNSNLKYVEACLRCLRTTFLSSLAETNAVYQDVTVIPHLVNIISKSTCTKECVTTIFASCCQTTEHQIILCNNGAIAALVPLLTCEVAKVQIATLRSIAAMCYENEQVSAALTTATYNGDAVPLLITRLLARDKSKEVQMGAAKCLTYMYRGGAIEASDPVIILKTLPCLVRMCKKDCTVEENVEGAETLAYLIEISSDLQQTAAITDHVFRALSAFIKQFHDVFPICDSKTGWRRNVNWNDELKQAAFRAFAALGANDEDIRKKVIETDSLMKEVVAAVSSTSPKVQVAAIRCLHSLSRSVQQLRTSLQDFGIWKPLVELIRTGPREVLTVASSVLCNLLLEFSPSKEPVVEAGAIEILVNLTANEDPALRLNGIWALMNMAFQTEQKLKTQIIHALGTEKLFLLLSDPNPNILMKTLGLLRNLLSSKPHIDGLMHLYGNQIMQAVVLTLEGDHTMEIKEQTLCILSNVADGDTAKEYIMGNEDVLKKLISYMMCSSTNLQLAATICITNLVWSEEDGYLARQTTLREMGVQKFLQQLLNTTDAALYDKVTKTLQQFSG